MAVKIAEFQQHSEDWHKAKMSTIGASEIYSLIREYCPAECIANNINEPAFNTPSELYYKITAGVRLNKYQPIFDWGLGVETYVADRFNREKQFNQKWKAEHSQDFVTNTGHKLLCCSPDSYITPYVSEWRQDCHNGELLTQDDGKGLFEIKTCTINQFRDWSGGAKWQYIFQLNYQMVVRELTWGVIGVLVAKDPKWDNEVEKGRLLAKLELLGEGAYKELDDKFDMHYFIYKKSEKAEQIIYLALNRFDLAVKEGKPPRMFSSDCALMALVFPKEKAFGSVNVADEKEIDTLLNERHTSLIAETEAGKDKKELTARIMRAMKFHQEIVGSELRAARDARGTLRFYKLSTKQQKIA